MPRKQYPPKDSVPTDPKQEPKREEVRRRARPAPKISTIEGLPTIVSGTKLRLSPDGKTVHIQSSARIDTFRLNTQGDQVRARSVGYHGLTGTVRELVMARDGVLYVLLESGGHRDQIETRVAKVTEKELVDVCTLPVRIMTAVATRSYLVVVAARNGISLPELLILRRRDGRLLGRKPASTDRVRLTAGRADEILVGVPNQGHQVWFDPGVYLEEDCPPEPPSPTPKPRQPECGPAEKPRRNPSGCEPDSTPPEHPTSTPKRRNPQNTCVPGDSGIPDGCVVTYVEGNSIDVVNLCEPEDDPCAVQLDWEIGSVQQTPKAVLVTSRDRQKVALLDRSGLRPLYEHHTRGSRVSVLAAAEADTVLLVNELGTVQFVDPTPILPAPDLDLGFAAISNSQVFLGQSPALNWSNGGKQTGTRNVLIVPVLEAGQDFEATVEKYFSWAEQQAILADVKAYYDEVSYHNPPDMPGLEVKFSIFGRDTPLYNGPPVSLPKHWRDYWPPPWTPGGIESVTPLPTGPLTFSGDEVMRLNAHPEKRDALVDDPVTGEQNAFEIHFPAASYLVPIPDAPPVLNFGPIASASVPLRSFSLQGEDRQGNSFSFTADTSTLVSPTQVIDFTMDVPNAVAQLENVLTEMLNNEASGQGSQFEPVVRWHNNTVDNGWLHITFRFAAGPGNNVPNVSIFDASNLIPEFPSAPSASQAANFGLPGDETRLEVYLYRILADATVDHEEIPNLTEAYFELKEKLWMPQVDTGSGTLRIRINLSTHDGREPAKITLASHDGLDKIGMDNPQVIVGEDVGFSGSGAPLLSGDTGKSLFNDVYTAMVSAMIANHPGPETEAIDEINAFFGCASPIDCQLNLIHCVVVTAVHPAPSGGATMDPPLDDLKSGMRLRAGTKGWQMKDNDSRVQPIGANRRKIISWMRFTSPGTDASTLAHELGHGLLGFEDQYEQGGDSPGLKYLGGLDLMGDSKDFAHYCAFHKRLKGWLEDEAILPLDRPPMGEPIANQQVVLVQLEAWDPELSQEELESLVSMNLPGTPSGTPVVAAVFLRLQGTRSDYDVLELRGPGPERDPGPLGIPGRYFSEMINPPRIMISTALTYSDDTRYSMGPKPAVPVGTSTDPLNLSRRKIHLIDHDLRETDVATSTALFDFASVPDFPEVGLTVELLEWGHFTRGGDTFNLARLAINWSRGAEINLTIRESVTPYRELIVVRPEDIPADGLYDMVHYIDTVSGSTFRVPAEGEGPLLHKIVVWVRNLGDEPALNVQTILRLVSNAGDQDSGIPVEDITKDNPIEPDVPVFYDFDWNVASETNTSVCFRAEIGDRDVPLGPDGSALATDVTDAQKNWVLQNAFLIKSAAKSPPEPVEFFFRVHNDGLYKEHVMVVPEGLGEGARVIVSPAELDIPRRSDGIFHIRVELEEELLHKKCGKDITFELVAWRQQDHTDVRWGVSKYTIRPRYATETVLEGFIEAGGDALHLWGIVKPDVGASKVLLHIQLPGQDSLWQDVPLGPGATYDLVLPIEIPPQTEVSVTAHFDGTQVYASSISNTLHLDWTMPG